MFGRVSAATATHAPASSMRLEDRSLFSMVGGNGFAQRLRINLARVLAEANQEDSFDRGIPLQKLLRFPNGNAGGPVHRKAVGAGADGGKRDGAQVTLLG